MKTTLVAERLEVTVEAADEQGLRNACEEINEKLEDMGIEPISGVAFRLCNPITNDEGEIVVQIPDEFRMYTADGDAMMKALATRLIRALEKPGLGMVGKLIALQEYLMAYAGRPEDGVHDTSVREAVWEFLVAVCSAKGIDSSSLVNLWNEAPF